MQILPTRIRYGHASFGVARQAADVLAQSTLRLIEVILVSEFRGEERDLQVGMIDLVADRKADSQQCQGHHDYQRAGYGYAR